MNNNDDIPDKNVVFQVKISLFRILKLSFWLKMSSLKID